MTKACLFLCFLSFTQLSNGILPDNCNLDTEILKSRKLSVGIHHVLQRLGRQAPAFQDACFLQSRPRGGSTSSLFQAGNLKEVDQNLNVAVRDSMELPAEQIGVVIGKGGVVIKELERMSSCQIWVDPRTNIPGLPTRILNLQGVPTRVEAAKRMILDRMALHESTRYSVASDGTIRDTMNIPEEWVGAVIGKGGTVIKSIMQASGARVFINGESIRGTNQRQIHLTGLPPAISYAKQLIAQRVPPLQHHRAEEVPPPGSFTKYICPQNGVAPIHEFGTSLDTDQYQQDSMHLNWQKIYESVNEQQARSAKEVS
jgi:rRNA processing protein Krr1/Pno1